MKVIEGPAVAHFERPITALAATVMRVAEVNFMPDEAGPGMGEVVLRKRDMLDDGDHFDDVTFRLASEYAIEFLAKGDYIVEVRRIGPPAESAEAALDPVQLARRQLALELLRFLAFNAEDGDAAHISAVVNGFLVALNALPDTAESR